MSKEKTIQRNKDYMIFLLSHAASLLLSTMSVILSFLSWVFDSVPIFVAGAALFVACGFALAISMKALIRLNLDEMQ